MSIKMIVSDLDNTLLRSDKTISNYTSRILKQCMEQGIKFVPATARLLRVLDHLKVTDFLLNDALITSNGSQIYVDRHSIYQRGFSHQEVNEVLSNLMKHYSDKRITVEIANKSYANHDISEVDPYESNYCICDFTDLPKDYAYRIIINVSDSDSIHEIAQQLPSYAYIHGVSDSPISRILHRSVSKAEALTFLCSRWNIQPKEIVCFGDDENDLEMFSFCGTSVAMSNAIDAIKTSATHHTGHHNNDGVARWIEENLLNQQ